MNVFVVGFVTKFFRGEDPLCQRAMHFAHARFDEAIEARPLSAVAQRDEVFFALDELLFWLVAQRIVVVKPRAKASVVALRRSLKGVELTSFD